MSRQVVRSSRPPIVHRLGVWRRKGALAAVVMAAALAACMASPPDYSGTSFRCGETEGCPEGFFCAHGFCTSTGTRPGATDGGMVVATMAQFSLVDAYLDLYDNGSYFGSAPVVRVGPGRVGVVRIDLSSLPTSATVIRAELVVTTASEPLESGSAEAYRLTESWDEAFTSWEERSQGSRWAASGAGSGSFAPGVVASFAPATANAQYRVPIALATVQLWVENPGMNHGLKFVSTGTATGAWHSREAAPPPSLEVWYWLP